MFDNNSIEQQPWLHKPALVLFLFTSLVFFIRLFLRGSILEIDEAEQIVMAQHLLPGYPDQPPLYSWLQYLFFKLLGRNLMSLALLKSILLFGCFYSFHHICRLYCQSASLAWCATMSWVFIPAISLDLIKDNTHSVLALFAASVTWYWFVAPSNLAKAVWYAILGFIIGIGFLSKFNYVIFLILLISSAISLSDYRKKIVDWHIIITLLLAGLIASPYFLFVIDSPNLAFRSAYKLTSDRNLLLGFIHLIRACLIFLAPMILITYLFFPIKKFSSSPSPLHSLLVRYHVLCLLLLISLIFFSGMGNFATRWLIPILFLDPLLLFRQVKLTDELKPRVRYFLILALSIQLIFLMLLIQRGHNEHKMQDEFLIREMRHAISTEHHQTEYVVADSLWLLGNFMLQLPHHKGWLLHPATYPKLPRGNSLLIWQTSVRPIWIDFFTVMQPEISGITQIENPNNHRVIGGYAYSAVK